MAKATVAAVVFPETGNRHTILLTRRKIKPFMGSWCLPGGHIDPFEPARQAVIREVHEETGLEFAEPGFIGWFDEIFPEYDFHAVVLAFSGTGSGVLCQQPDEVSELGWFPLREAMAMPLAFNHNLVLRRYADTLQ